MVESEPAPRYRSPGAANRRAAVGGATIAARPAGTDRKPSNGHGGCFARPSFTLDQVRTFLAVATREHVTEAARSLRVSQSAVTQQIQLLERALGVQLLERVGRNVRLTNGGVEVAAACLLIMKALDNLDAVVRAVRDPNRGAVSVGASQLAGTYFLPAVMAEFAKAHPQVHLAVVVSSGDEVCQQVGRGELDFGLVDGAPAATMNLMQTQVAATEVVVVGHPSHVGAIDGGTVRACCYLAWPPGPTGEALSAQLLGDDGSRGPRMHIDSMETARRLVRDCPGFVAAMPLVGVRGDLASGALVRLGSRSETLPVFAVRREGVGTQAREALWRLMTRRRPGAEPVEGA